MSYSLDFRIRVFEIKEKEGLTFQETSAFHKRADSMEAIVSQGPYPLIHLI
jgi:hypothetical protein